MEKKKYIEREAAIAMIRENGVRGSGWSDQEREDDVVDMIESIPTADVRPVVHGHNTGNARIFECSECGYGFADIFLTNERDYPIDPNFCPNCGADMREIINE